MPEFKARSKIVDRGTSSFSLVSLAVDIALNVEMPNTNYKVFYRQLTGAALSIPATSNTTTTGFRASIGVGIAATFEWLIIED